MKNIFNRILKSNHNKSLLVNEFIKLSKNKGILKIFNAFSNYNEKSEIRFVGGCLRKILNNETVDDIDLATNINPDGIKKILENKKIKFFDTGISHGTITAIYEDRQYEITSLRKDISTDGRHAKVQFTDSWKDDASRRDFSINCIYSDLDGNLFDPYNGKSDLTNGKIVFIGDAGKRISEDYLRILRYIRFYLKYSKNPHDEKIKKVIRQNISGIKNLSKERLLDELKKIFMTGEILKMVNDKFIMELFNLIFPELKNLHLFSKLNDSTLKYLLKKNFIFLISAALIDETDNVQYFMFKYKISNDDKKKINFLKENYKQMFKKNYFSEKNLNKIHYYTNSSSIIDLIDFKIFISQKINKGLIELKDKFSNKSKPIFPIKANYLMEHFNLKEGKALGEKLKILENIWINNEFKINKIDIEKVLKN